MFANHVEAELLQELQIRDHGSPVRWCVQSIGPETLVKSSKLEHKLAVEERSCDVLNFTFGYGSESSVTVHLIPAVKCHSDVVECWGIRPPQLG